MTLNQARVPAGTADGTGGRFQATGRTEAPVLLSDAPARQGTVADEWAGCWSYDDFTPQQRLGYDVVHRHAYQWAANHVGGLGMENRNYAEDYALWVARKYVDWDFDAEALGTHPDLHRRWDRERGEAAARHLTADSAQGTALVRDLSGGSTLHADTLRRRSQAQAWTQVRDTLTNGGVRLRDTVDQAGRRAWRIDGLDGDTFPGQVWISDQRGSRVDADDEQKVVVDDEQH